MVAEAGVEREGAGVKGQPTARVGKNVGRNAGGTSAMERLLGRFLPLFVMPSSGGSN